MPEQKSHIWYASSLRPYPENEPWYYDSNNYPALNEISNRWDELKDEIHDFIKDKDQKFRSSKTMYDNIDLNDGWSSILFQFWGLKFSNEFKKNCPKTMNYIKMIPGVVSLSLSRLSAKSTLAEHSGDTNAIMRCHLGIEIPGGLPYCGLRVKGEEKGWQEGKWVIFNDAYKHAAWNNTDYKRSIIIMDVIRPEFLNKKNLICAFILTRHVSYVYDKIKFISIMPVFIKTILFAFILGIIFVFKPVYNFFKIFF